MQLTMFNIYSSDMNEENTVKERLIKYLQHIHLGQVSFAKSCGLSAGFVNNIVNSISEKTMLRITKQYPDLNPLWVLHGVGNMIISSKQPEQIKNENNSSERLLSIIESQQSIIESSMKEIEKLHSIIDSQQSLIKSLYQEKRNQDAQEENHVISAVAGE